MQCIVSFAYSLPFPNSPEGLAEGEREGREGVQFTPLKGYRHFEIRPGESQQDNETGQKSYCPIEINLNKTWGCRLVVSPTVFFMAHTAQSKSPSPAKWGAQQHNVRTIVCAFAPHYANYGRFSFVIKYRSQIQRGRARSNEFNFTWCSPWEWKIGNKSG